MSQVGIDDIFYNEGDYKNNPEDHGEKIHSLRGIRTHAPEHERHQMREDRHKQCEHIHECPPSEFLAESESQNDENDDGNEGEKSADEIVCGFGHFIQYLISALRPQHSVADVMSAVKLGGVSDSRFIYQEDYIESVGIDGKVDVGDICPFVGLFVEE